MDSKGGVSACAKLHREIVSRCLMGCRGCVTGASSSTSWGKSLWQEKFCGHLRQGGYSYAARAIGGVRRRVWCARCGPGVMRGHMTKQQHRACPRAFTPARSTAAAVRARLPPVLRWRHIDVGMSRDLDKHPGPVHFPRDRATPSAEVQPHGEFGGNLPPVRTKQLN